MTTIYIIRHAEAEGNRYRRIHGQYNSVVTARGWKQIAALAKRFSELSCGKTVLAPCRDGVFGHPMFYRAVWKNRFTEAQGDTGGKTVLMSRADEIERIEASAAHFRDMDTPDEYKRLLAER